METLIKKLEKQINKTPSGELRNLLTDVNIMLQSKHIDTSIFKKERFKIDILAENGATEIILSENESREYVINLCKKRNKTLKHFKSANKRTR